jgi:hypothetical protein
VTGPSLPWIYEYEEETRPAGAHFLEKPLLRPAVWVRLAHGKERTQLYRALVDSGCDYILTPEWVAREIGVRPDAGREITVRIGGAGRRVHFGDVRMQLYPPETDPLDPDATAEMQPLEWDAQVGFFLEWQDPPWLVVLGQCGFFDEFTIVMSRLAQHVAITERDDFDARFPLRPTSRQPETHPRFEP